MDLKDKIIDISYKLFKQHGYDNVKVEDICEQCEITKPTFYRYIGSKDELLSCFYANLTSEITRELLSVLNTDNYWEQICIGFQAILTHSQKFGADLYSQLFISNLKENKGTFDFVDTLTQTMTAMIDRAQKAGQIKNSSAPHELYMACAHMSFGYGIIWCLNKGNFNLLDEFRAALQNVCDVPTEYRIT